METVDEDIWSEDSKSISENKIQQQNTTTKAKTRKKSKRKSDNERKRMVAKKTSNPKVIKRTN